MDKFFIQAAFKSLDDIDKEENKEIKKALIESRLKEKKTRDKKSYIRKVAEDDFEVGKTFDIDDFSQFKNLCKEDGYAVTKEDFDFYFDCLDEIRENNYYSLNESKKKTRNKKYKGYNIWYDDEYANAYLITDDDGDDVTPGYTFKSVKDAMDEIDSGVAFPIEEKDEKSLDEAKKKKRKVKKYPLGKGEHLNTCAGDPDINTAAFNHATSINNGSPTTSLGEAKNTKSYEVQRYGRWNFIIINPDNGLALRVGNNIDYTKPQSKDNKILFFKSKKDAENYIKDNLLDKEKLEEKIPKEVKKAYKNTALSAYAKNLPIESKENIAAQLGYDVNVEEPEKRGIYYNQTPIDFENAEYKLITKEEAHQYEKPRDRWHLILVFKNSMDLIGSVPQAIRFDKSGKALSKVKFDSYYGKYGSKRLPLDKEGNGILTSTKIPVPLLIDLADSIYYTDELDHLNQKYFDDIIKTPDPDLPLYKQLSWESESGLSQDEKRAKHTLNNNTDTYGNEGELNRRKKIIKIIRNLENEIDDPYYQRYRPERIKKDKERIKLLKRYLYKNISRDEYKDLYSVYYYENPEDRDHVINSKLARVIALKNMLKDKVEDFKAKSEKMEKNAGYTSNEEYQNYLLKIATLEKIVKDYEQEIEEYKTKLNSIDKDSLNKKYEDEVYELGNEIEKINDELKSYGVKSVFKEGVEKTKFNLKDPEDIKKAKEIKEDKESEEDLVIIHPMLNHKKPHPGDAIVTCKDCDEVFYLDKNELKQDLDDPETYNKDMQCENCGAQNGYNYVGDVALKDTGSAEEAIKERDASLEDDFESKDSDNDVKELEPIDNTEEPEEIIEESFDNLVNKYLNKIYENINSYKTLSITQTDRNNYLVEGIFKLKDNNKIKTSFLLEATEKKNNNITLKGSNKILAESKEPFEIKGKIDNKKLIFESFKYNYVESINENQYLVEGLEENN